MPWNPPIKKFHSELRDAGGNVTQVCTRGQRHTFIHEKEPNDPRKYVFVMITEENYAKDPPDLEDFIILDKVRTVQVETRLSCEFEVPADLADDEVLLGFAPHPDYGGSSNAGYDGGKYPVRS